MLLQKLKEKLLQGFGIKFEAMIDEQVVQLEVTKGSNREVHNFPIDQWAETSVMNTIDYLCRRIGDLK